MIKHDFLLVDQTHRFVEHDKKRTKNKYVNNILIIKINTTY
jgi:hypothetical protein